jgi:hypothetical protein
MVKGKRQKAKRKRQNCWRQLPACPGTVWHGACLSAYLTICLLFVVPLYAQTANQMMTISANGKYLWNSITGKPVFITGDSPQVIEQISNESLETYLADRAARGFNALWILLIDNLDQTNEPANDYGNVPFDGADFTNEDSSYWAWIDHVVQRAQAYGMVAFMNVAFVGTPQFGADYYYTSILDSSSATLTAYGTFLGNRYKSYPNIVWLLGGDAPPKTASMYTQIDYIGAGIAAADPNHLITLEGCRECTGVVTAGQQSTLEAYAVASLSVPSWMGLNWAYAKDPNVISECQAAYTATSGGAIPPLMGEDTYELDSTVTSTQVRIEGYWEVLSGCYLGRLFGNDAIWTFNAANDGYTTPTWQSQLSSVASVAQEYMGKLFRTREHWLLAPDTSHAVLTGGYGSGSTISVAACTSDGQSCIIYDPIGSSQAPQVNMGHFSGTVQAWWYNPQTAAATSLGTFSNSGTQTFTPSDGNDWVLVLDLASAGLGAPGLEPPGSLYGAAH